MQLFLVLNATLGLLLFPPPAQVTRAPLPQLKAALVLEIIELEKGIAEGERDLFIYVLSAPEVAEALRELVGQKVGNSTFRSVEGGDTLPNRRPDVMFVGTSRDLQAVIAYARKNKSLTITDRADVFQRGVSVSILTERRRPKVSLNPAASVEEGLEWELDYRMFRNLVLEFRKL
jgi:hypothetical protein